MQAGIGPADHLREVGVDVVHDLPGVGGGLQDHPLVPVIWNVRSGKSLFRAESPSGYAQWFGARQLHGFSILVYAVHQVLVMQVRSGCKPGHADIDAGPRRIAVRIALFEFGFVPDVVRQ